MSADSSPDSSHDVPVALVHGWGGSFESTWQRNGFTALLEDAGRPVIGIDLLGHGDAPKPHDPEAYADLTVRVFDAIGNGPVDAVGFSLGALTLLRAALARPDAFRRIVFAGIGQNVFDADPDSAAGIIAALEGGDPADDNIARLFTQYASQPGNDMAALAAVLRRPVDQIAPADLAAITCPVLVVVGDQDFVHPADDFVAALPNSTLTVLRGVDHFATPDAFAFIDATLDFIDAVPA